MSKEQNLDVVRMGGTLIGAQIYENCKSKKTGIPFVGILGVGSQHARNGKKSIWINGQNLSPNIRLNNNCAGHGQLEGIATEEGAIRFLETIYDFPAIEGSCVEYNLDSIKNEGGRILLKGNSTRRDYRSNPKQEIGEIHLTFDPNWERELEEVWQFEIPSLSFGRQHRINGLSLPKYFKIFLGGIEEQGFDHPYGAVTESLQKERAQSESKINF
ncbi:hypothetical protein J4226_03730 [Candidatus Pacearchaeota archaeon]|nr:hypothetical protein [Candidatus Pacearchaeota archaeon]